MRIHLIPNSHVDPVWLWDKFEGIDEVVATFRAACDRLDEFPSLTFTASSMQLYAWVREYDPPLFRRIRHHVTRGRWEVVGGWWVEADSNLPTEAGLRHQAAAARQFETNVFGHVSPVAYLPDSFGHPATLPRILAESGFRYFIFCRPSASEKDDLPANLFHWEYEGHRILAYRLKHHYMQGGAGSFVDADKIRAKLDDIEYRTNPINAFFFGVGDHGGGPTITEIQFYNDLIATSPEGRIGYSSCRAFFEEAEGQPDIPVYRGDLHMHAVGCYSVLRTVKNGVRTNEHGLDLTARAMDMAGLAPAVLAPLWQTVLFNQFHDILPGSCSPAAAQQACEELGGVSAAWRSHLYRALKRLSAMHPAACAQGEYRIFNALPFPVTAPIQIEAFTGYSETQVFRDAEGRSIDIQEIMPSVRAYSRRWEFVDTLPACGFKSYAFGAATPRDGSLTPPVHFRPASGIRMGMASISADGEITFHAAGRTPGQRITVQFLVLGDTSDTWGHGRTSYDDVEGVFAPETGRAAQGPVSTRWAHRLAYSGSTIDAVYTLYRDLPWILLELRVLWTAERKILKMALGLPGPPLDTILMEAPGGVAARPADGIELPLHHWVAVRTGARSQAILQDGAFACDCTPHQIRFTLIRSSLYGYDRSTILHSDDPQNHTDQGEHRFRFCIPAPGAAGPETIERLKGAFLNPSLVIRETPHPC